MVNQLVMLLTLPLPKRNVRLNEIAGDKSLQHRAERAAHCQPCSLCKLFLGIACSPVAENLHDLLHFLRSRKHGRKQAVELITQHRILLKEQVINILRETSA